MIAYYFDTSALIKQYVNETGSDWVRQLFLPEHDHLFITSRLTMPEMYSAFARRLRDGSVTETSYTTNVRAFERDGTAVYRFLELTPEVVQRSRYLLERYPLRANDAVQLASAVIAHHLLIAANLAPLQFLSADERLVQVANVEGLICDNPNIH